MKKIFLFMCLMILFSTAHAEKYYQLEEMIVLSRHNIRSPLSSNDSVLGEITPNKWFNWTSKSGELSLRGGELEILMGQYFRKWLVDENLITEDYTPIENEIRFYANSMQRTIATAKYFSSAFLPMASVKIEHKFKPNKMDSNFNPQLIYFDENFRDEAMKQIQSIIDKNKLDSEYRLLERVLDMKKSVYAKKNNFKKFNSDDTKIILEVNKEPAISGSLKLATQASDALILQLYEMESFNKAAFGHGIGYYNWERIARIKDVYEEILFTAPIVAVNVANPLLKLIDDELALKDRKFSYLCGHDSNILSVLTALEVENYSLPESLEKKTPIGSKLVIQKWLGKDGVEYVSLTLVYQSLNQIINRTILSDKNPPLMYHIQLKGLIENEDKLYRLVDVQERFKKAINAYENLIEYEKAA